MVILMMVIVHLNILCNENPPSIIRFKEQTDILTSFDLCSLIFIFFLQDVQIQSDVPTLR